MSWQEDSCSSCHVGNWILLSVFKASMSEPLKSRLNRLLTLEPYSPPIRFYWLGSLTGALKCWNGYTFNLQLITWWCYPPRKVTSQGDFVYQKWTLVLSLHVGYIVCVVYCTSEWLHSTCINSSFRNDTFLALLTECSGLLWDLLASRNNANGEPNDITSLNTKGSIKQQGRKHF